MAQNTWLFDENHVNVLPVEGNSQDDLDQGWMFTIQIEDERGNKYVAYPAAFTQFSLRKDERLQILNGFNEVVHMYAFGKNPDQIQLSGKIFASNHDNPSFAKTSDVLINPYNNNFRAFATAQNGVLTKIAGPPINGQGTTMLTGVANGLSISLNAVLHSVLDFSMTFIAVDTVMGVGDELPNLSQRKTIRVTEV